MSVTWEPLRGPSHALALDVLLHGPLSRVELARRLDLSAPSLSRLTKPLVDSGLLVEVDENRVRDSRPGRPQRPLDVVPDAHHFVGIKLTGDVAYGVVTTLRADIVESAERPLSSIEPEATVAAIADLTATLAQSVPSVTALGVGIGGRSPDHSLVSTAPFLHWTDVPFGSMVETATGLPVVVENDLVALTEAEHWFGAGRDARRFAVITIGAGVGYGLVVGGQVVTGVDAGFGPVGHIPLNIDGPVCFAGHRGCSTAMLSIPSICGQVSAALGRPVTYDEVLDLSRAGDRAAGRVVHDAGRALGLLCALVGNLTMPEKIVLSGEGIRLVDVARPAIDAAIHEVRDIRAKPLELVIRPGDFFQWARGAAVMAIQTYVLGTD